MDIPWSALPAFALSNVTNDDKQRRIWWRLLKVPSILELRTRTLPESSLGAVTDTVNSQPALPAATFVCACVTHQRDIATWCDCEASLSSYNLDCRVYGTSRRSVQRPSLDGCSFNVYASVICESNANISTW